MKVKVIKIFKDKYTRTKFYHPGDIVEFEEERAKDIINRGLGEEVIEEKEDKGISLFDKEFEKKELVEALKSIGVKVSGNMKEETLLSKVAELDEEDTAKLKTSLGIE